MKIQETISSVHAEKIIFFRVFFSKLISLYHVATEARIAALQEYLKKKLKPDQSIDLRCLEKQHYSKELLIALCHALATYLRRSPMDYEAGPSKEYILYPPKFLDIHYNRLDELAKDAASSVSMKGIGEIQSDKTWLSLLERCAEKSFYDFIIRKFLKIYIDDLEKFLMALAGSILNVWKYRVRPLVKEQSEIEKFATLLIEKVNQLPINSKIENISYDKIQNYLSNLVDSCLVNEEEKQLDQNLLLALTLDAHKAILIGFIKDQFIKISEERKSKYDKYFFEESVSFVNGRFFSENLGRYIEPLLHIRERDWSVKWPVAVICDPVDFSAMDVVLRERSERSETDHYPFEFAIDSLKAYSGEQAVSIGKQRILQVVDLVSCNFDGAIAFNFSNLIECKSIEGSMWSLKKVNKLYPFLSDPSKLVHWGYEFKNDQRPIVRKFFQAIKYYREARTTHDSYIRHILLWEVMKVLSPSENLAPKFFALYNFVAGEGKIHSNEAESSEDKLSITQQHINKSKKELRQLLEFKNYGIIYSSKEGEFSRSLERSNEILLEYARVGIRMMQGLMGWEQDGKRINTLEEGYELIWDTVVEK